jgi:hypothetical protein
MLQKLVTCVGTNLGRGTFTVTARLPGATRAALSRLYPASEIARAQCLLIEEKRPSILLHGNSRT